MTHKFDIQGHEGYINVGFYDDGRPGELFITMAKEGSTVGGLMDVIGTLVSMGLQYGVPLEVFVNKFAAQPVRAGRVHQEPGHPDRQERDRLHLPLARHPVHPRLPRGQHPPPRRRRATAGPAPPPPRPAPLSPRRLAADLDEPGKPVAPMVKTNGHRTATMQDLEEAEAAGHHPTAGTDAAVPSHEVGLGAQQQEFARFQSDAPSCDNCGALTVRCGTCYRCFNCGNSMGCS